MDWCLDTGLRGHKGCHATELRTVLEAALEHHARTAPDGAAAYVRYIYRDVFRADPSSPEANRALKEAEAAKQAVLDMLPRLQEQMRQCIDCAVELANHMGGNVTATVKGHIYPQHASGIFRRLQVTVDRACPTEE